MSLIHHEVGVAECCRVITRNPRCFAAAVASQEQLRCTAIDGATQYGYDLKSTVFLRVGESTNIGQYERYASEDLGGTDLTLRAEGTAAIARDFVENGSRPSRSHQRRFWRLPVAARLSNF